MRRTIAAVVLVLAWAWTSGAGAQNARATELCSVMRAMQWLADIQGGMSPDVRAPIDMRERVACGAGIEAAPDERWENGAMLRSGDAWYYPNGAMYYSGSAWYYPNGAMFASGNAWYYPHGGMLATGGTYYAPNGAMSSESALLAQAIQRLPRERGDWLLGLYQNESVPFWRTVYLARMVWESR
jgi:hypothetical protein